MYWEISILSKYPADQPSFLVGPSANNTTSEKKNPNISAYIFLSGIFLLRF